LAGFSTREDRIPIR